MSKLGGLKGSGLIDLLLFPDGKHDASPHIGQFNFSCEVCHSAKKLDHLILGFTGCHTIRRHPSSSILYRHRQADFQAKPFKNMARSRIKRTTLRRITGKDFQASTVAA